MSKSIGVCSNNIRFMYLSIGFLSPYLFVEIVHNDVHDGAERSLGPVSRRSHLGHHGFTGRHFYNGRIHIHFRSDFP